MAQAWYTYGITQGFGQNGEKGVDLGTPFRTPITALYAGTVTWAGRTAWACGSSGGEVCIVCNVPGLGTYTSYYLHLDQVQVKVGDVIKAGQQIGLSGGQLSGGTMPVVNCQKPVIVYSTGVHTEFGFNAPWVSGPGSNINPTFAINAARNGTLDLNYTGSVPSGSTLNSTGATTGTTDPIQATQLPIDASIQALAELSANTHRIITRYEGFESMATAIQDSMEVPDWNNLNPFGSFFALIKPWFYRLLFLGIALIIIYFTLHEYIQGARQNIQQTLQLSAGQSGGGSAGGAGAGAALEEAPVAAAL